MHLVVAISYLGLNSSIYQFKFIALYFISTCKQRVNSVNRKKGKWLSFPYLLLIDQMVFLL